MPDEKRPDEDLREFWEDVRGGPLPEPIERRFAGAHPGDLVIATSASRMLVRIHPDGQITYGPEYTPDEAAVTFWTAMAMRRVEMEERLIQFSMQEQLLLRIAEADVTYERAQRAALAEGASENDRFTEERARANLEARVHQLIEFSRGLLRRPDVNPTPAVGVPPPGPARVP
jgi:hypothetical protein